MVDLSGVRKPLTVLDGRVLSSFAVPAATRPHSSVMAAVRSRSVNAGGDCAAVVATRARDNDKAGRRRIGWDSVALLSLLAKSAGGGNRTRTLLSEPRILSPV